MWADTYDTEGKRVARKKNAPPPPGAAGASVCRHCGIKFHAERNSRCQQHSGKWIEVTPAHRDPRALQQPFRASTVSTVSRPFQASETNANGSAAVVDRVAFPEGGLWLCCGSTSKSGERVMGH